MWRRALFFFSYANLRCLQILAAFVVQSSIGVVVSGYTWILSSEIRRREKDQDQSEARGIWMMWSTFRSAVLNRLIEDVPFFRAARDVLKNGLYPGYRRVKDWLIGKQPEQSEDDVTPTTRRLEFANRILVSGSDAQTFTGGSVQTEFSKRTRLTHSGIALLISALVQSKNLSLYHMHILYDTNSLVM
jgi:hypothetical protein